MEQPNPRHARAADILSYAERRALEGGELGRWAREAGVLGAFVDMLAEERDRAQAEAAALRAELSLAVEHADGAYFDDGHAGRVALLYGVEPAPAEEVEPAAADDLGDEDNEPIVDHAACDRAAADWLAHRTEVRA